MTNSTKKAPASLSLAEAVKAVFGEYPEYVISPINTAAEAISWMEELFSVIGEDAKKDKPCAVRIKRLAAAGKHLAFDIGEYEGSRHAAFKDAIRAAEAREVLHE